LKALRAQLRRKLLIVWDGAAQHKSRIMREYLDSTNGVVQMALLFAYSPDLKPVECLWAWLKRHALAKLCPRSLGELKLTALNKLRSGQNRHQGFRTTAPEASAADGRTLDGTSPRLTLRAQGALSFLALVVSRIQGRH